MTYARNTDVSIDKSKAEIERLLMRYGADQFMSGWDQEAAYLKFRVQKPNHRMVSLRVTMPPRNAREFTHTEGRGLPRSASAAFEAWEQACRSRWRAMKLILQAMLEAVELGVITFDEAFLPFIQMPDGSPLGDYLIPKLAAMYESGRMPVALLPEFKGDN